MAEMRTRVSRGRPVFYLFRVAGTDVHAVARFTDRTDAIRSARLSERLGWHAEVRLREERPRSTPGPWLRLYRTIMPDGPGEDVETKGDSDV